MNPEEKPCDIETDYLLVSAVANKPFYFIFNPQRFLKIKQKYCILTLVSNNIKTGWRSENYGNELVW